MELKQREANVEDIRRKLSGCRTPYNQIAYLEDLINRNIDIAMKKFVYTQLTELYLAKSMFDKAAKAIRGRASLQSLYKDVVEDYAKAGEYYIKAGRVEEGEDMFTRALGEANTQQASNIRMTMKNILFATAKDLEARRRTSNAVKFYEKILRIPHLNEMEKEEIKNKLRGTYKSLGMFRELKMLDGK